MPLRLRQKIFGYFAGHNLSIYLRVIINTSVIDNKYHILMTNDREKIFNFNVLRNNNQNDQNIFHQKSSFSDRLSCGCGD